MKTSHFHCRNYLSPCVVKVKWGKERYDNVEVNTDEPPEVFKMQLFSLTGVPPDRQKVMISGAMIAVSSTPYLPGYQALTCMQDEEWGKAQAKIKNVSNVCAHACACIIV